MIASNPLEQQSDALPNPDTHRGKCVSQARPLEFFGSGEREAGARHTQRVPERDCAAIWVHAHIIIGKP